MSRNQGIAAVFPAILLVASLAPAATELVENARFERGFGPVGEIGPQSFGRHIDDARRSVAPRMRDRPGLVPYGAGHALAVIRPEGEIRGVSWSSAPIQVAS